MSALSDPENVWLVPVEEPERPGGDIRGMTEDEAYAFLSRTPGVTASALSGYVTAAGKTVDGIEQDHSTQGMIALVPSQVDIERLYVNGGEPPEDIHLTLFFLGDVTRYPATMAAQIAANVQTVTLGQQSISATGFGGALWNPTSDSPCIVLNVGGEVLCRVRHEIGEALEDVWALCMPEQHSPWVPHVALAYTDDVGAVEFALERVGPIVFDRVRIAFGEETIDLPLYGGTDGFVAAAQPGSDVMPYKVQTSGRCGADKPYAVVKEGDGKVMGCHPSRAAANEQIAALYASEADAGATQEMATQGTDRAWNGVLVVEGVTTGDGRQFAEGSLTWPEPPLSLLWQEKTSEEHGGSVVVGQMTKVWRDETNPNVVRAEGFFDATPAGDQAMELVTSRSARGVSVDVDSVGPSDIEYVFPQDAPGTDGVSEDDADVLALMFGAPPELMIFQKGRIRAATLVAIPAFVEAQIEMGTALVALQAESPTASGEGETEIEINVGGEEEMARKKKCEDDAIVAALAVNERPPAEWFSDPQLEGPTPLTVTEDGRIFGHAALFNTCHIGSQGACIQPPFESHHDYFLLGETVTAGGDSVAVGNLTLGTGHAPTFGVTPLQAVEHYDNTGTSVATVTSGNDAHGIWIAGSVRPGITEAELSTLRAAKLSGDWRRIGGQLRLVAMLAVNVPGFPVPRLSTRVVNGRQLTLVASGILVAEAEGGAVAPSPSSAAQRARLTGRMAAHRTAWDAQRRQTLRGRMHSV